MKTSENRIYAAIDLKSFYASVECIERGLDPLATNLVVADASRTSKTICLAVSPALKSYGIPGRARLFEVIQKVKEANTGRRQGAPGFRFSGSSVNDRDLKADPALSIDYIAAPPRMALYMEYSTRIYNIYLRYIAPEDIHVYSIDEVFVDVTDYLRTYRLTARELVRRMVMDVLKETGITATAGIGTNLYLGIPTAACYGHTDRLWIFGESGGGMPRSWRPPVCIPWGTLPDAPWGNRRITIMRSCSTSCSASTQSFS